MDCRQLVGTGSVSLCDPAYWMAVVIHITAKSYRVDHVNAAGRQKPCGLGSIARTGFREGCRSSPRCIVCGVELGARVGLAFYRMQGAA